MKFANRISSIRRHAWKQCRSCSVDSESMCSTSLESSAEAGWIRSPLSSSIRVTGDLEAGMRVLPLMDAEPYRDLNRRIHGLTAFV